MAKLLLLDGNSLAYRAFFALPTDMATSSGQVTNAVFGFTSMLVNLLKDHRPDAMAVAFDRPEPTFRHQVVADYKAGRAEAPDILRQQMGLVRKVVEALHIPVVEQAGFEADDVIATMATAGRDRGDDVIIVTGDRDTYQLVEDPHVKVLYNRRGVSDYALYDEAGIKERTGVAPSQYVTYAALRGDPSDNLPGVAGVGEKTAARLVNDYSDLDGIYDHLGDLTPKLRQSLEASEDQARHNAEVIPLVRDLTLDVDEEELKVGGWDPEEVHQLFGFLEFRSLWERLVEAVGAEGTSPGDTRTAPGEEPVLEVDLERPASAAEAGRALEALAGAAAVALEAAWEGLAGRSALLGLALAPKPEADDPTGALRVTWIDAGTLGRPKVVSALRKLLSAEGPSIDAHRAKEIMRGLEAWAVDLVGLDLDTAVAAYLVDPAEGNYLLEDLATRYGGFELGGTASAPQGQLGLGEVVEVAEETARRAAAVARVAPALRSALEARHLLELYEKVERPLVRVLARMEQVGVRVDIDYLSDLIASLTEEVKRLDADIQDMAGEPFNVNSTPQLRSILFEKLGLAPQKRTKTGYSTDAASLERLRGEHPIVDALLRYRELEKLRSTYGEGLLAEVGADGRIHASFNQTVARTGRLSSDRPNLHNIPVRSEEGRRFRRAFIPSEGRAFLVADYNQIELRVIAHLAQDPGLIDAFRSGQDIHQATASRIFGVAPGEVTLAQRSKAKMVSYGLAYGMEAYGLSQRLGISVEEAKEILDAYFDGFPRVRAYMDSTVQEARQRGYTETLFGRRRQIPELASTNVRVRQAGERQAMNAGIQGLAADIFKVALVALDARLEAEEMASRLVLQVHDEVILEVPPDERDKAAEITVAAMGGACDLAVPLEVNLSWGDNWAEAKA